MRRFALVTTLLLLVSCANIGFPVANSPAGFDESPLFITEVAQSASHGHSRSDKVEVFCGGPDPCQSYRVCDTGSECSALQSSLQPGQRNVVSRGNEISPRDQVWLATEQGYEIPST